MSNPLHDDWLRRFREDLRTGDMESLRSNVELAGLDTLLNSEFCELVCQEDARQVAILIGSLGEENADDSKPFIRLRASYQLLTNQIDIDAAANDCSIIDSRSKNFYISLLSSAQSKHIVLDITPYFATVNDLEYGINLLINTGNSKALSSLLKKWQTIDKSDLPWLKTCRAIVKRGEKIEFGDEANDLARITEELITTAPVNQAEVTQEMRIQWSNFAFKAKDGELACKAASEAFKYNQTNNIRFSLAKALILNSEINSAIDHLDVLLNESLSGIDINSSIITKSNPSTFDILAAEGTLISINKALKKRGLKPFLMSGTLLGYAREGNLLPHDKDVDIGIIGWENQFTVAEALLETGHFKIDLSQLTGRNRFLLSANDLRNGIAADIFIFHDMGDHFLHGIDFDMGLTQKFRFSKFELEEVEFLSEHFYVPSDIDRNLSENYGDWRSPTPSYVVTLESPALCDKDSETQLLLTYLELLKTLLNDNSFERIKRIHKLIELRQSCTWEKVRTVLDRINTRQEEKATLRNLLLGQK